MSCMALSADDLVIVALVTLLRGWMVFGKPSGQGNSEKNMDPEEDS